MAESQPALIQAKDIATGCKRISIETRYASPMARFAIEDDPQTPNLIKEIAPNSKMVQFVTASQDRLNPKNSGSAPLNLHQIEAIRLLESIVGGGDYILKEYGAYNDVLKITKPDPPENGKVVICYPLTETTGSPPKPAVMQLVTDMGTASRLLVETADILGLSRDDLTQILNTYTKSQPFPSNIASELFQRLKNGNVILEGDRLKEQARTANQSAARVEELTNTVNDLTRQINELRTQGTSGEQRRQELEKQLANVTAERARLQIENETLRQSQGDTGLRIENERLRKNNTEKDRKITDLEAENLRLKNEGRERTAKETTATGADPLEEIRVNNIETACSILGISSVQTTEELRRALTAKKREISMLLHRDRYPEASDTQKIYMEKLLKLMNHACDFITNYTRTRTT